MKTKAQLIEEFLSQPIAIGDRIYVDKPTSRDPKASVYAKVVDINGSFLTYKWDVHPPEKVMITKVRRDISHIGADPFSPAQNLHFQKTSIDGLMYVAGFDYKLKSFKTESVNGIAVPELCWEPVVTNSEGKEVPYQRGFVWNLLDKQLLIDSIYNSIDIGKFVFRSRSWSWVEKRVKNSQMHATAFHDIVDGKQRLNAIIEFMCDQFEDSYGNKFSDFSDIAKRKFRDFEIAICKLDDDTDDAAVLRSFLSINFTGAPMSKEHLDWVKSIQI